MQVRVDGLQLLTGLMIVLKYRLLCKSRSKGLSLRETVERFKVSHCTVKKIYLKFVITINVNRKQGSERKRKLTNRNVSFLKHLSNSKLAGNFHRNSLIT